MSINRIYSFPLTYVRLCNIHLKNRASSSATAQEVTKSESGANVQHVEEKNIPIVTSRKLDFVPKMAVPVQAWVENLDTLEEKKLGIVDLHPTIFGKIPNMELIWANVKWQELYKHVDYEHAKVRAEMKGGGRKPWPQKGTGRARHGSINSPLFLGGGVCHGPRSPTSHFYMLSFHKRIYGLTSTLSCKLAQDDLHIVDSLDIPTDDPKYLQDLAEKRAWGISVLLVDDSDIMPRNITASTDSVKHINLMPVYGLNVHSMLKHETLVLTLAAVEKIEERILYNLHRTDISYKLMKFNIGQQ